jgi:hypothetical protein
MVNLIGLAVCSRCGFVPEDSCQIDLDHIDGDRNNWDTSNLRWLCANCHRLKSKQNGDNLRRGGQPRAWVYRIQDDRTRTFVGRTDSEDASELGDQTEQTGEDDRDERA